MDSAKTARRVALMGLMLSLTLILGYVESFIMIAPGIPGVKLGLSNTVLLYALYLLSIPQAIVLMLLKVVLSGFMFAGVNAMMYALAGGTLSLVVMILLKKVAGLSPVGVSIAGGVSHNVGQVVLAMLILHLPQLMYYLAVLIAVGAVTGLLTGLIAQMVMKHVKAAGYV